LGFELDFFAQMFYYRGVRSAHLHLHKWAFSIPISMAWPGLATGRFQQ